MEKQNKLTDIDMKRIEQWKKGTNECTKRQERSGIAQSI